MDLCDIDGCLVQSKVPDMVACCQATNESPPIQVKHTDVVVGGRTFIYLSLLPWLPLRTHIVSNKNFKGD